MYFLNYKIFKDKTFENLYHKNVKELRQEFQTLGWMKKQVFV